MISTAGAKYKYFDIKSFYLETPLDRYEYMRMPADLIPKEFTTANNLHKKIKYDKNGNGWIYMEIRKGMYGFPQLGILANKLLKKRLAKHGYYELPHTPCLWKHVMRPITFTLAVGDFGVKYKGQEHDDHLLSALREDYTVDVDETGGLYCGISLEWNYEKVTLIFQCQIMCKNNSLGIPIPSPNAYPTSSIPLPPSSWARLRRTPPLTKALPSTTLAKSLSNKLWGASYIMGGWWT
jgi:hypothetical protein